MITVVTISFVTFLSLSFNLLGSETRDVKSSIGANTGESEDGVSHIAIRVQNLTLRAQLARAKICVFDSAPIYVPM